MIFKNIFLITIFLILSGCGIFQWEGHYININSEEYKKNNTIFPYRGQNGELIRSNAISKIKIMAKNSINISLPNECSNFGFAGIITPFTPPVPFFWSRSWSSKDSECNYFGIRVDDPNVQIKLLHKGILYNPLSYKKEKHLYTFPIRAKDIDSGSIIIEKDGEKVEVPFEYKYLKFWY